MPTSAWKPLQKGEKVSFLGPSSAIREDERERFADLLSDWGLELYSSPIRLPKYYKDQGTPKQRAQAIIEALENEEVKAIFMRGGSGAEEVIEHLKRYDREHGLPRRGIPLIGFSDATQFHHYLGSIGSVSAIQGPDPADMVSDAQYDYRMKSYEEQMKQECLREEKREGIKRYGIIKTEIDKSSTDAVRDFLLSGKTQESPLICVNEAAIKSDKLEGKMVISNDHSRRSEHRMLADKSYQPIMLLEGGSGGEGIIHGIGSAIKYLRETGQLQNLQAIVLSKSDGECFFDQKLEESDLSEAKEALEGVCIPVFFGAPFGHGSISSFDPLPLGTETRIQVSGNGMAMLTCDAIRTTQDIDQVRVLCAVRPSYMSQLQEVGLVNKSYENSGKVFQQMKATLVNGEDKSEAGFRNYLAFQTQENGRGYDITAIDGHNLLNENVMLYINDFEVPSFDKWKKYFPPQQQKTKEDYKNDKFAFFKGRVLAPILALLNADQLKCLDSLTLVSKHEFPDDVKEWLGDFTKDHNLEMPIRIAHCPSFPKDRLSQDRPALISAEVKVMNLHEIEMDRLDKLLKIGDYSKNGSGRY